MAKAKKAFEVREGEASAVIKRLAEDAEVREAVGRALDSARGVYDRVTATKKAGKLLDDKKLHAEAEQAIGHVRAVAAALAGSQQQHQAPRKRRGGFGRKLIVLGAAGAIAVVASEDLRSKVLDALFGAEEEFQYTPPPAGEDAPGNPLSAV
jgi:hypothetical protein